MSTNNLNSIKIQKGNELLPIGTVILIELISQPLMIYGRKQQQGDKEVIWDYVACPYPQGHISDKSNVFLNHSQIKEIVFKGFESEGEILMKKKFNTMFSEDVIL